MELPLWAWGLVGSAGVELFRWFRLREQMATSWPYWVVTTLIATCGVILVVLYDRSSVTLNPVSALNIGASAPLALSAVTRFLFDERHELPVEDFRVGVALLDELDEELTPREVEWKKVQNALADPQWDFRTANGISKDVGLSAAQVEWLLRERRDVVRHTRSQDGRTIYKLKTRPQRFREIAADVLALAKQ